MATVGTPITAMRVQGFKSIRAMDLTLNSLNVLIGANGAGKSNFIELFWVLNQMVDGRLQVAVQRAGGASALLHYGVKQTQRILIELIFGQNAYRCMWEPTVDDGLVFANEDIFYYGRGFNQRPWADSLGAGQRETNLPQSKRPVAGYVMTGLRSWRVYHFHDTSETAPVKLMGAVNDNRALRGDAGNLAAFLYRLRASWPSHYATIRDTVRLVAPFFDDFILDPLAENQERIRLEWRERDSDYPFLAHHLSDGTLRFMCLATLLLQPQLPATILMDEPELGLHPYAISVLASLIRSAAQRTQLIISTQSVTLVNQFSLQDLLIIGRQGQETIFERPNPEQLAAWLEEYSLGDLWEKNVLGGRPS